MSGDLSSVINMGALAIHQLLEKSQSKGVEIDLETATLENEVCKEKWLKLCLPLVFTSVSSSFFEFATLNNTTLL